MDKSETIITKTDHALSETVHYFLAPTRPTYEEAENDLRCWLVGRSSLSANPDLSCTLLRRHPEAKLFTIPGQQGSRGLNVTINPDGSIMLQPEDDSIPGFGLTPISTLSLLYLLNEELTDSHFTITE